MATLSQTEIAAHLDMSPRNLRDVLNFLGLDWRAASIDEIRLAYIRKLRSEAAGRAEKDLAQIRARKELAQARREERDLAKEDNLLLLSPDIEPMLISVVKEIQVQLLEAGNRILQEIESNCEVEIDNGLILGPLHAALRSIAASGDQFVAACTQEPSASVSGAIAAGEGVDREERQITARE